MTPTADPRDVYAAVAEAWRLASHELGIAVSTDGSLTGDDGRSHRYAVFVPDFGGPRGTICGVLGQDTEHGEVLGHVARQLGYFFSLLSESYAEYDRRLFTETLDDWRWFGIGDPPEWYTGKPWTD